MNMDEDVTMAIKHLIAAASIMLVSTLAVPAASAINKGTYFGLASSETEGDASLSDFNDGSLTSGSVDDTDTGIKLFAGFQFTDSFAIEGGLVDFGGVTFDGISNGSVSFAAGPVTAEVETDGVFFNVIAMKTFPSLSLYGKLGVLSWDADGELVDTSGSFDLDDLGLEDSGESAMVGFGLEFRPKRKMAIRAEWEQYQDALVDERDIDFLSVTILFRR